MGDMLSSCKRLLRRALSLALSHMGTTRFAVAAGLIVFALTVAYKWYKEGWSAVKADWGGAAGVGLLLTTIIWLCLFAFCIAKTIYNEHMGLKVTILLASKAHDSGSCQRPRVKLEISHILYSTTEGWTSPIVAANHGESTAYKVSAECRIGTDEHVMRIGPVLSLEPVSVLRGNKVPAILTLTTDGKTSRGAHYNDLLEFILDAMVEAMPAFPEMEFDVIYWDFERRTRYRTPHVLRHSAETRYFVIDLRDTPEPEPETISIELRNK